MIEANSATNKMTRTNWFASTRHQSRHQTISLVLLSIILIVHAVDSKVTNENVEIELSRLSARPHLNDSSSQRLNLIQSQTSPTFIKFTQPDAILTSEAVGRPPIYQSAPKQIDTLTAAKSSDGIHQQVGVEQSIGSSYLQPVDDLVTAAGHYKKKKHKHKKKKKIIVVKKKKKKKKKGKKKKFIIVKKKKKKKGKKHHHHKKMKKKKKKKKIIYYKPKHSHRIEHHHEPSHHHGYHHQHQEPTHHHGHHYQHHEPAAAGKYYEYRSVPEKGAWDFGFKRGNMKHHIERKEHGNKNHFETIFNWKDKKGSGKHLFDYNHVGHHEHSHHAAATKLSPNKLEITKAFG